MSTLAMWAVIAMFRGLAGPVTVSIFGALAHNIMQLFLAYFLFVKQIKAILLVSPVILTFGIITGVFNGIAVNLIIRKIQQSKQTVGSSSNSR